MFVPVFVMVTVALGTTAPVGSLIVPVITPCTVCDHATPLLAKMRKAVNKTKKVRTRTLHPLCFKGLPSRVPKTPLKQPLGTRELIFQYQGFNANVATDRAIAAYSIPDRKFCQE